MKQAFWEDKTEPTIIDALNIYVCLTLLAINPDRTF